MSQCMALFEIMHALIGIVKSPVLVTTMQVMSRIVALVAIYYSPNAQGRCFFSKFIFYFLLWWGMILNRGVFTILLY